MSEEEGRGEEYEGEDEHFPVVSEREKEGGRKESEREKEEGRREKIFANCKLGN